MQHVKQIRDLIDQGDISKANSALENLLELGPNNIEALKLRAQLLNMEGRYSDEARIWDQVHSIDPEDPDGVAFVLRCHLEERENVFFSEEIPGAGRRFITYPRMLITTSMLGLVGCLVFLTMSKASLKFPFLAAPTTMLACFSFLVLLPWAVIIWSYFRTPRYLFVHKLGVTLAKRFGKTQWLWQDFSKVVLAHHGDAASDSQTLLTLVFVPKDPTTIAIVVDLTPDRGTIRARTALVREVSTQFVQPEHVPATSVYATLQRKIVL